MKLLAAISQHGLGHLAQAAPVLNALRKLQPDLKLTIWSGLSQAVLRARIEGPFEQRADGADVGLIMHDAMRVDMHASHAAYQAFHADWSGRVGLEADWLRAQRFDRVFADIAYLPLAAAAQAGIPGFALCSLNWADISQVYLTGMPGMAPVFEQMQTAYAAAEVFLQPTPSMPMSQLQRRQGIAPIAAAGCNRRQELIQRLIQRLGIAADYKLILLGFGGVAYQGKGHLPEIDGVVWLTPDGWPQEPDSARRDRISFRQTGLPFMDLLASSDALITKVGYGSFVEAAAHALPVLYLDRPDWPETPYLAEWLLQHGNAAGIDESILFSDRLAIALNALWRQPRKVAVNACGAEQAARHLLAR
jgi:hypothetical protein